MNDYRKEDLAAALQVLSTTIINCERIQPKFAESSSQHSLLKNRIKALYISRTLIVNGSLTNKYTKEDLTKALSPISSIISKCEKAQLKFLEGTSHHTRFENIIKAMYISKSFITDEINKRD